MIKLCLGLKEKKLNYESKVENVRIKRLNYKEPK